MAVVGSLVLFQMPVLCSSLSIGWAGGKTSGDTLLLTSGVSVWVSACLGTPVSVPKSFPKS